MCFSKKHDEENENEKNERFLWGHRFFDFRIFVKLEN